MPTAPKRPCRTAGCPALTSDGYCDAHRTQEKRQQERWRGSAHSRGYGRAHRKVREQTMLRDSFLCQNCLKHGRITPATDSHHIKKLKTHPELHLDPSNRMSVCKDCHKELDKQAI